MKTTSDFPDDQLERILIKAKDTWERALLDPDPKLSVDLAHKFVAEFYRPDEADPDV